MAETAKKSVLVVEDEDSLQHLIAQALEKNGFSVLAAGNGDEGLAVALHQHPDLIILDIIMPHDGITMLRDLRSDEPYGKQAPVIFLTNQNPDTDWIIEAIEKYQPIFYLIKANTTPATVVEKVKEALNM